VGHRRRVGHDGHERPGGVVIPLTTLFSSARALWGPGQSGCGPQLTQGRRTSVTRWEMLGGSAPFHLPQARPWMLGPYFIHQHQSAAGTIPRKLSRKATRYGHRRRDRRPSGHWATRPFFGSGPCAGGGPSSMAFQQALMSSASGAGCVSGAIGPQ